MVYSIENLKREIRIALDQNMTSDQLIDTDDIDTLSLEDIIESKIADAASIVEDMAPAYLLDGGKAFASETVSWESGAVGYGAGAIQLPDDFLRLLCFSMSDWSRVVTTPIYETDPAYAQQRSRFPGIRGCPEKPVVAIVNRPAGLVLEFYSCTSGEGVKVSNARYIPVPKVSSGEIEICEKLKPAVVYRAACMVASSVNDGELAAKMLNFSNELIK